MEAEYKENKERIKVGDKTFNVIIASNEKDRKKGLQDCSSLKDDEGMLFVYDDEQMRHFWMKDTTIPLDIIGIDDDMEVDSIHHAKPLDETLINFKAQYVLEINPDSGIQIGDELEFEDDEKPDIEHNKMLVLDENGDVQMELKGGERIFSRKNTRVMIKLAARAWKTKDDSDFKKLGKKVFHFLDVQDSNDPQYVELKKDK